MIRPFTRLLSSLLVALLILTGQQVTSARGTGHAVTEAVLCIGGGLVTVQLDAEGNPVGPAHICPDATLAFLPDLVGPRPVAVGIAARPLSYPLTDATTGPAARAILPPSTGPPAAV
jgi:hypothetical protein